MKRPSRTRIWYGVCLVVVVLAGAGSRILPIGLRVFDKYLGDALYAVMFYLLLSIFWEHGRPMVKAAIVTALMLAIEAFQLTSIPLAFKNSSSVFLRAAAVGLGTGFSWRDIAAYAVGIAVVSLLDLGTARRDRPANRNRPG